MDNLTPLAEVRAEYEQVLAELDRVLALMAESTPEGIARDSDALATLELRAAEVRDRCRALRDRFADIFELIRAMEHAGAASLADVRGTLECIIGDRLKPALADLQALLDQCCPGDPVS